MMPGNIGYLRIAEFTPQTAERCREAIRSFTQNGYTAMVIDLRGDPGGLPRAPSTWRTCSSTRG